MAFSIEHNEISADSNPYIIAEVGINHNGKLETALEMVKVAKEAGADAVKFQTFKATEFCGDPEQLFTYFSQGKEVTEPMLDMFQRMELKENDWLTIQNYAREIGITFFSTPQNITDLELLLKLSVPALKVGSDDLTNLPLIERYASEGLPLILSTGMANLAEVDEALALVGWPQRSNVSVLVCTSQYPTPAADVNIQRVRTLQDAFPGLVVGFSDHTEGNDAAIMAAALGAQVYEKHFTLDHNSVGPDHWFSSNIEELNSWVKAIRQAHVMRGTGIVRPSVKELEMRVLARRSVVALQDIQKGTFFTPENTGLRRPGNGMPPRLYSEVLGKTSKTLIKRGDLITFDHLA